jgi:hypothetical protein
MSLHGPVLSLIGRLRQERMGVVRRRVATIESQAAVSMVTAKRYLDALEALAA